MAHRYIIDTLTLDDVHALFGEFLAGDLSIDWEDQRCVCRVSKCPMSSPRYRRCNADKENALLSKRKNNNICNHLNI